MRLGVKKCRIVDDFTWTRLGSAWLLQVWRCHPATPRLFSSLGGSPSSPERVNLFHSSTSRPQAMRTARTTYAGTPILATEPSTEVGMVICVTVAADKVDAAEAVVVVPFASPIIA